MTITFSRSGILVSRHGIGVRWPWRSWLSALRDALAGAQ